MHEFTQPIDIKEIKVGQVILIQCSRLSQIFRSNADYLIGVVSEVFDAGDPVGVQIELRNTSQWWRWIPSSDGGQAFVKES